MANEITALKAELMKVKDHQKKHAGALGKLDEKHGPTPLSITESLLAIVESLDVRIATLEKRSKGVQP